MNKRAEYYAKKDARFADYLTEGRAFGPHGADLVIANSIAHYDDTLSRELTDLTVKANLAIRELGFKPYLGACLFVRRDFPAADAAGVRGITARSTLGKAPMARSSVCATVCLRNRSNTRISCCRLHCTRGSNTPTTICAH